MNFGNGGMFGFFWLLPLLYIALVIYFVLRLLRAIERGVDAHERIAQELARFDVRGGGGSGAGSAGT